MTNVMSINFDIRNIKFDNSITGNLLDIELFRKLSHLSPGGEKKVKCYID